MRLWTLHPCYLDGKGLVALWREALLAQKVLQGDTRGYRRHPQLDRFRASPDPSGFIAAYLQAVAAEAELRRYRFDRARILAPAAAGQLEETSGQLAFEWRHLHSKLASRDPGRLARQSAVTAPAPHPLFRIISGPVRGWERAAFTGTTRGGT